MACLTEETVLRFAEGRLDPAELATAEAHVRSCVTCGDLLAVGLAGSSSLRPPLPDAASPEAGPPLLEPSGTLRRGTLVGRYTVLSLIGRGGMGEVYAAYDPQLDRKVAVKVLHGAAAAGGARAEARLLREAQAIAKLSHPNVITVHDVGTVEDRVFVAMEYIDGQTLATWLISQPRGRAEILTVFVAAARGLAAAHAAGFVHRDFKPQNVMVAPDGGVRVTDFGLVRRLEGNLALDVVDADADVNQPLSWPLDGDLALTRTGELVGTPIYMAPEQFRHAPADARTDQFSFCVALYQALYGRRPFAGAIIKQLAASVSRGAIDDPPADSKVPSRLRKIVLRGLRVDPRERYASMDQLIAALDQISVQTFRRKVALALALMLPLAVGLGVRQGTPARAPLCAGGPARLAGSWELNADGGAEPPRHARIRRAFLGSGKSYAGDVFVTVAGTLSSYARRWAALYRETCEATQLRGEQSAEVLDLKMSCLQERLDRLRALCDVFSRPSAEVVANAVSAATALGSLDRCTDVALLRSIIQPPDDPAARARVSDLRAQLNQLRARFDAGQWAETEPASADLVRSARAVGYEPLLAEALELRGTVLLTNGQLKPCEDALVESFHVAEASRHDEVRAEDAVELVFVIGAREADLERGLRWADTARAILRRLGAHELLQAWLLNNLGAIYSANGDSRALDAYQRAIALKEKVLGPRSQDVGVSEANLAMALTDAGRPEEALAHARRAVDLQRAVLGEAHPLLATALNNLGESLNAVGRHVEARQALERAQILWETELGPDHRNMAFALTGIGVSYLEEGNAARALEPLERAWIIRQAQEREAGARAETAFALARALWETDRNRPRALRLAETAEALYSRLASQRQGNDVKDWLKRHQRLCPAGGGTAARDWRRAHAQG
jgi:tetratricopeptide (TPR) repeat protein